jgi:hypothetical protein
VRYRLMATYQGSPFEAGIGPTDEDIVLFAACPPPEELGFEPATGHWRRQLRITDVQAVWESRPVGTFRGERCMVLDDLGDRLHIGYLGHDGFRAEQLGYWQVDRGVFELVAPRTEVTDISEERTEYRRQVTAPHPTMPPREAGPAGPAAPAAQGSGSYQTPEPRHSAGYAIPVIAPEPTAYRSTPADAEPAAYRPTPADAEPAAYRPVPPDAEPATYQPSSGPEYGGRSESASGRYRTLTGYGLSAEPAGAGQVGSAYLPPAPDLPIPDDSTGVALPLAAPAPLPLEAEAMRAASAARRPRPTARRAGATSPSAPDAPEQPGPVSQSLTDPAASDLQVRPGSLSAPVTDATSSPAASTVAASPDAASVSTGPAGRPAAASPATAAPVSTGPAGRPAAASPATAPPVSTDPATRAATASPATASPATASPPTASPAAAPSAMPSPVAVTTTDPESLEAVDPGAPVVVQPAAQPARPRRAARRRMATERLFGDLASLAGIPADSYAVGEDVEGALCLVQTQQGFEVFHSAGGARHELQVFTTEESACFYLFGVLAAEAVRNGSLARVPASLGTRQA